MRRDFKRLRATLNVRVLEHESTQQTLTHDISLGGAFLLTEQRWPIATHLLLEFSYDSVRFELPTTVQHTDDRGVGVRFEQLDPGLQRQLISCLEVVMRRAQEERLDTDRRTAERFDINLPLNWRRGKEPHLLNASTRNISVDGLLLDSAEGLDAEKVGDEVFVLLPTTAGTGFVGCTGTIARLFDDTFAVRFENPDAAFRTRLSRAIIQAASQV